MRIGPNQVLNPNQIESIRARVDPNQILNLNHFDCFGLET